jgi:tetratricopeptide (TPR) repeat protein
MAMEKKKKFSRKELKKPDEFVAKGAEFSELLSVHRKKVLIGVGAGLGVLIVFAVVYVVLEERNINSSKAINEALTVLGKPVKSASLFSGSSDGDDTESFASSNEKDRAVAEAFGQAGEQASTGSIRTLATLGQAQSKLALGEYDEAATLYQEFIDDPKGSEPFLVFAYEGLGLALEGQGNLDAALKQFTILDGVGDGKYSELSLYHQARIHELKGERDKAKELNMRLAKQINEAPKMTPMAGYLQERIAGKEGVPAAKPTVSGYGEPGMLMGPDGQFMPTPGADGQGLDEEQLRKLQEMLEKMKMEQPEGAGEGE